jgi:hypothetical protein
MGFKRVLLLGVCQLILLAPGSAGARKQTDLRYPFDQVWNAALRMVRVDMRLPVTDRDPEAGYFLFDYLDNGKSYAGSLELVRGERDARPLTKTVVQVQGMPSYVEQMLLDKLQRKLREEFGDPIEPAKPVKPEQKPRPPGNKKPEPKPDEGTTDEAPPEAPAP